MKKQIIVTLEEEGLHYWKNCDLDEVEYLKTLHRHIFHIKCIKTVSHSDRDIEFIKYKHQIRNYLDKLYFSSKYNCLLFGPKSCEMIAEELINEFDLDECEVMEDGENGAIVKR
jgi:hypothetical protein